MVLDTEVEITIGAINKKYYTQKGYNIKMGDKITVPIEDLYIGSRTKVNVQCQNPDCGIIKPMPYENYIRNINSTDIHVYYCNKCNYLKKIELTSRKQSQGLLTRKDAYYWQFEENRKYEFLNYIKENTTLDNMARKDYSLFNAILEYETNNLEFAKKLKLDIEDLFKFKKPQNYYTKEMVVKYIKQFIKENDRFPSQQEMGSIYGINSKVFNKYFKDYCECKKEIGYYNKNDLIDNRGDVNRSHYELFTANFLIAHGLGEKYLREEYPFKTFDNLLNYRSDFAFYPVNKKQIHIEVWGDSDTKQETEGYFKDYLTTRKKKEELYSLYSNEIILISIEPSTFSGGLKSIERKLYDIFKNYLELEYKIIDIELLLPYNSMTEDEMFKKLMECSKDKNSLPFRRDVAKIKGGNTLLKYIDKRYGGMRYFAEKYNLNISHRTNYWNSEKVFECFDYMINKYDKILTKNEFDNSKDNKFKGFYTYTGSNGGFIYHLTKYIENLVNSNIIIKDYLHKYLLNVSKNTIHHYHSVKPEHQLLAKQILDKYNKLQNDTN